MDVGLLATGDASFKVPAHEVVDLTSDDTLDSQDAVSEPPLVGDLNADLGSVSGTDEEIEPSESLSLLEDVLEEMGDEHLFNGGKLRRCCHQILHVLISSRRERCMYSPGSKRIPPASSICWAYGILQADRRE